MTSEELSDTQWRYGWLRFTPDCIQCLNTAKWWLAWMCVGNTFQSMTVNGLMSVGLSSIEKRFDFSSSQSSFIANAYDFSTIPVIIIVSCIGSRAHRPRWVAWSIFLLAFSAIIYILPHFISPDYTGGHQSIDLQDNALCRDRSNNTLCDGDTSGSGGYLALFIIGRLLMGVGATPLYTSGVTFMDDCLKKSTFSLFVAIFYAAGVVGPAIGLVGGGYLLTFFTDFATVNATQLGITNSDPRWVGNWWLGFIVSSVPLFFLVIPMSGFSRDIPGASAVRAKKKSEAYKNAGEEDYEVYEGSLAQSLKEVPRLLKGLFTNPTFLCVTLFGACDSIIIGGFGAFGPKYVESQFTIPASTAGMIFGLITIPAGAGGTVTGGLVINRLKLSCPKIMRGQLIISLVVLLFASIFFIICDPVTFIGVNKEYFNSSVTDLTSECNAWCNCTDVQFTPICSHENTRYFSPCHAGCSSVIEEGTNKYYNCSCIPSLNYTSAPVATSNSCTSPSCSLLPLFSVMFFLVMFLMFTAGSMTISATVRSVKAPERALAIGVQWIAIRLLGTIPGPVLMGTAFDGSCALWRTRCGESRGSCLSYHNDKLALYLFFLCTGIKGLGIIFILIAWRCYVAGTKEVIQTSVVSNGNIPSGSSINTISGDLTVTAQKRQESVKDNYDDMKISCVNVTRL